MKRVLVTGSCGFIGSHLVDTALREGFSVRTIDSRQEPSRPRQEQAAGRLEQMTGDVCDPESCLRACEGVDAVFHNAGMSIIRESFDRPEATMRINVEGTRSLLKAAASQGVTRFVYSSSGKVYGDADVFPTTEEGAVRCTSPYAASKHAAEQVCKSLAGDGGLTVVVLRYLSVYGPRQRLNDTLIGDVFLHLTGENRPPLHALPGMKRDFTYIDDVVRANLLSMDYEGPRYDVFNIGSGTSHRVDELVSIISALLRKKAAPVYAPVKEGMVMRTEVDISRARRLLGYEPRVSLRDGLARTISWLKG